jgi:hypothetical protein
MYISSWAPSLIYKPVFMDEFYLRLVSLSASINISQHTLAGIVLKLRNVIQQKKEKKKKKMNIYILGLLVVVHGDFSSSRVSDDGEGDFFFFFIPPPLFLASLDIHSMTHQS